MKKGLSRDTVAWLNQPIDFSPSGILRYLKEKGEKALVDNHRLPASVLFSFTILFLVLFLSF